jgi:hypothetical protein
MVHVRSLFNVIVGWCEPLPPRYGCSYPKGPGTRRYRQWPGWCRAPPRVILACGGHRVTHACSGGNMPLAAADRLAAADAYDQPLAPAHAAQCREYGRPATVFTSATVSVVTCQHSSKGTGQPTRAARISSEWRRSGGDRRNRLDGRGRGRRGVRLVGAAEPWRGDG